MKLIADALRQILDYFQADEKHWVQGRYADDYYVDSDEEGHGHYESSYCLVGALRHWLHCDNVEVIGDLLREQAWCGGYVEWNDTPSRTREDVVLLLKHAVVRLECEEMEAS